MKTATLKMKELTCPSCIKKIEGTLRRQKGVEDARVLFNSGKSVIVFDEEIITPAHIVNIVQNLGYPVIEAKVKMNILH